MQSMKHPLVILPLLLVAGLVVNVAVAWGCAVFVHPRPGDWRSDAEWFDGEGWGIDIGRAPGVCDVSLERRQRTRRPGDITRSPLEFLPRWCKSLMTSTDLNLREGWDGRYAEARGWPFLSMWWDENATDNLIFGGFTTDALPKKYVDDPPIVLPLRPIWSGFVANSLLYDLPA